MHVCASGGWPLGPSVELADIVLFWEVSQALSALGFATAPKKSEMFKKVLNVQDIHGFISFLFTQGLKQDCMTECEECDSVHVCLFVFELYIICMWTTFLYRNLGIYIFKMVKLFITKSTLELDIKAEN